MNREQIIIRTSIIGILANAFLAGFKAFVGVITGSIAVTLDAVNNLSDALSSVITILGTKLAGKRPDKKHPFGHGRVEYLTAALISVIVLYAGVTSLVESVKKIIHPETPQYTTVSLIIIAVAVVVKIVLGSYVKGVGEKVNSDSLVASGQDATLDSVISASTLVAAIIFLLSGLSLEAWLAAVISLIIIKSGVEMLSDTLSQILGRRADSELAKSVKDSVLSFDEVHGAYDLILHNYGPDYYIGSVHVEVDDTLTAEQLDPLERAIAQKVYQDNGVILTGVGIYAKNTKDDNAPRTRRTTRPPACTMRSAASSWRATMSCRCTASTSTRQRRPSSSTSCSISRPPTRWRSTPGSSRTSRPSSRTTSSSSRPTRTSRTEDAVTAVR